MIEPGQTVTESGNTSSQVIVSKGGTWQPLGRAYLRGNQGGSLDWAGHIDLSKAVKGPNLSLLYGVKTVVHNGASFTGIMNIKDKSFLSSNVNSFSRIDFRSVNNAKIEEQNGKAVLHADYVINTDLSKGEPEVYVGMGEFGSVSLAEFSTEHGGSTDDLKNLYDNLDIQFKNDYQIDSGLYKYLVHMDIEKEQLDLEQYQPKFSWNLTGILFTNTRVASESVMAAADNQRALFNMWRLNDSYVFQRGDALRRSRAVSPLNSWEKSQPQVTEGVWANVYRGKYQFDSPYGRKVNQDYSSVFLGVDKANEGDFHNGTLYRGVFADLGWSKASFPTGNGDLSSKGLGAYLSWQGNRGHFWDAALRFDKLQNEYVYRDSNGVSGKNTYDTWAWGVSGQYGYHKDWTGGLYAEPVAGLSYGRMNATSYTLHNNLAFDQKGGDFLTGRAGLRVGKVFGNADQGLGANVYAKVIVNHDFLDAAEASTAFGGNTLQVHPIGEKDTWTDISLGVQKGFGRRGSGYLEFTKTAGGDVKSDWQVAAGLSFYYDPEPKYHGGAREENSQFFTAANAAGESTVLKKESPDSPAAGVKTVPAAAKSAPAAAARAVNAGRISSIPASSAAAPVTETVSAAEVPVYAPARSQAGTYGNVSYELAPVTVEADRPVWEKTLSPGTMSVVYPETYKGEMKTLPDMLESVAGVFVQRINGTGHYTLARIRGSTGQQVNIYVDGVLMNSSGETGVDLSQIPSGNIERIEVYRGYIPARFAGAAIGGAINIVTKKPEGTSGSASFGMRSYAGYTGNVTMTAPLAGGSLLFQVNRDQTSGEFPYTWRPSGFEFFNSLNKPGDKVWRQSNWYQMNDATVKWQDDHWLFKAQYMEKNEGAPTSASSKDGDNWHLNGLIPGIPFRGSLYTQRNKNTDFLLGRRQQTGDLEWGAYVNYGSHKKQNRWRGEFSDYTPMGVNSDYDHTFWGGRLDGSWKVNDSNLVEFLFNYSKETMKTDGNYKGRPGYSNTLTYGRAFLPKYDIQHYYFQVQDSMALDRRKTLIFTPEWRAEKMKMTTFSHGQGNYNNSLPADMNEEAWKYSYGLGLKKYVSDNWSFHGSYGTYYRAPNFYEMFGDGGIYVRPKPTTLGGGTITWESGNQYDFGTDWKGTLFGADTNLSLTYFNRHVKNMATPVYTADGSIYYVNMGEGRIDGLEMEAAWAWKNWELSQTVTWNHSRMDKTKGYTVHETEDLSGRNLPFPMTPKWETNTRLSYFFHDRKMSAFAEYHYTSDMAYRIEWYMGKDGQDRPDVYSALGLFNAGFKYNPGPWRFTVGVNDLFNQGPKQRLEHVNVAYPQQGRTYYVNTTYTF